MDTTDTKYLISFAIQRIDDIYAFCAFISEQLSDFSDAWILSKYEKDDLGFAFGYAACFKKNEIVYKTTMSILSDVIHCYENLMWIFQRLGSLRCKIFR